MKKNYKRLIAYILDMFLVLLVASLLSRVSFINPELKKYNNYYKDYQEEYVNYNNFITLFNKYYKDNKISDKEYNKLLEKYPDRVTYIDKYYEDKKISKKEYNKIINNINNDFQVRYKELYYNVNKYSKVYNAILIVVIILYFVGVNTLFNGQTLGKKIMNIEIVGSSNKVTFLNYLIRTLILYNPIYYLLMIIGSVSFNVNDFYNYALVLSNIKDYLLIIVVLTIIIRKDNRGLHDLLSKTMVVDNKSNINNKKIIDHKEN